MSELRKSAIGLTTRYVDHARMLWYVAPWSSTISSTCSVIGATAAILTMVATGRLIGGLYQGDSGAMWTWFGVFVAATIAGQLAQAVTTLTDPRIWAAYRAAVQDLIAEAGLYPRSLTPLDSELGRS